jgi:putative acetyltransferase
MQIRDFKPADSASLASIFHEAVRAVDRKDYNQAQVEVWSPKPVPAEKFLARVSDGRSVFVAVSKNDEPIAFIELEENGHIDCFYCHPDAVGTGVGTALYKRLESAALTLGLSRLYVEASEAARRFFDGKGFSLIERKDFRRNNVQIHNYLMEKNFR